MSRIRGQEVVVLREFSTSIVEPVDPMDTVPKRYMRRVVAGPDHILIRRRADDGWHDMTAGGFAAEVDRVAAGLCAAGVLPGDRVALMSRTRYEWTLLDCAIMSSAAVTVPIYETSSPEQVRWILADSAGVAVIVENPAGEAVVGQMRDGLPELRHSWCLDRGGTESIGALATPDSALEVPRRRDAARGIDLATIIYTSGTTGMPKGCPLSHGNLLAVASGVLPGALDRILTPDACTLVFLPLAHVAARLVQTGCLIQGTTMGHWSDLPTLVDELESFRPDFIVGVPRVFQKV